MMIESICSLVDWSELRSLAALLVVHTRMELLIVADTRDEDRIDSNSSLEEESDELGLVRPRWEEATEIDLV